MLSRVNDWTKAFIKDAFRADERVMSPQYELVNIGRHLKGESTSISMSRLP